MLQYFVGRRDNCSAWIRTKKKGFLNNVQSFIILTFLSFLVLLSHATVLHPPYKILSQMTNPQNYQIARMTSHSYYHFTLHAFKNTYICILTPTGRRDYGEMVFFTTSWIWFCIFPSYQAKGLKKNNIPWKRLFLMRKWQKNHNEDDKICY